MTFFAEDVIVLRFLRLFVCIPVLLALSVPTATGAGAGLKKVTVPPFADRTGEGLDHSCVLAGEMLAAGLLQSGLYRVFESSPVSPLPAQADSLVEVKDLQALGRALGVDSVVAGTILEFSRNYLETTAYGVTTVKVACSLTIQVREIDATEAEILFAGIFAAREEIVLTAYTQLDLMEIHRRLLAEAVGRAAAAMADNERNRQKNPGSGE